MSVNRHRPHVLVLVEDQANREIVIGFRTHLSVDQRQIGVTKNLGGWRRVCDEFEHVYVTKLYESEECHVVMLIDFDERLERREHVKELIPDELQDRVCIIGVLSEPEKLKDATKLRFEEIGLALAADCPGQAAGIWNHELLKHNVVELGRISKTFGPIVFPSKADIWSV